MVVVVMMVVVVAGSMVVVVALRGRQPYDLSHCSGRQDKSPPKISPHFYLFNNFFKANFVNEFLLRLLRRAPGVHQVT